MASHMRNYWKKPSDITRCDNVPIPATTNADDSDQVPAITNADDSDQVLVTTNADVSDQVVATNNYDDSDLVSLLRRKPADSRLQACMRSQYTIRRTTYNSPAVINLTGTQKLWDDFLRAVQKLCTQRFWNVFLSIHTCPIGAIDAALGAVRENFDVAQSKFPGSRRGLLRKINTLFPFWRHVLHTYKVDLTPFADKMPSNTKHVEFKFIDPLWAWVAAARKQDPLDMHWKPVAQKRGQEVYGGGVQYGKFLVKACEGIPEGAYPMLIGVHWDGTSARGLSSSPICVCVGNTNRCDSSTQY